MQPSPGDVERATELLREMQDWAPYLIFLLTVTAAVVGYYVRRLEQKIDRLEGTEEEIDARLKLVEQTSTRDSARLERTQITVNEMIRKVDNIETVIGFIREGMTNLMAGLDKISDRLDREFKKP